MNKKYIVRVVKIVSESNLLCVLHVKQSRIQVICCKIHSYAPSQVIKPTEIAHHDAFKYFNSNPALSPQRQAYIETFTASALDAI